eukprot:2271751-Amphidinium_carterae.1
MFWGGNFHSDSIKRRVGPPLSLRRPPKGTWVLNTLYVCQPLSHIIFRVCTSLSAALAQILQLPAPSAAPPATVRGIAPTCHCCNIELRHRAGSLPWMLSTQEVHISVWFGCHALKSTPK